MRTVLLKQNKFHKSSHHRKKLKYIKIVKYLGKTNNNQGETINNITVSVMAQSMEWYKNSLTCSLW